MPTVKLDKEMEGRVKALASSKQRSSHWIMKQAIERYVEEEEFDAALLKEAQESKRHYEETGLHLTGEEVNSWLAKWGTEEESEIPKCHV